MDNHEVSENIPEGLSRKAHGDDRFDFNVPSEQLSKHMEGKIPPNSAKSTTLDVNNFE